MVFMPTIMVIIDALTILEHFLDLTYRRVNHYVQGLNLLTPDKNSPAYNKVIFYRNWLSGTVVD